MDSLQVDSIISDANFYIITRDANQEISGFQAFSGQNRDNFQFVPNSGRAPEFGTFWHHWVCTNFDLDWLLWRMSRKGGQNPPPPWLDILLEAIVNRV